MNHPLSANPPPATRWCERLGNWLAVLALLAGSIVWGVHLP